MKNVTITLNFENEKLDALEFSLQKEKTSVQAKLDELLKQLYEKSVPEAVREYLDSRSTAAVKPKRPPRSTTPKSKAEPPVMAPDKKPEVVN